MTLKRALELCRDLWKWLSEHPAASKRDWPEWKWNGGPESAVHADCPCCQYAVREGRVPYAKVQDCAVCPLLELWGYPASTANVGYVPCERHGSPFRIWHSSEGQPELRIESAIITWKAAEKKLKELEAP